VGFVVSVVSIGYDAGIATGGKMKFSTKRGADAAEIYEEQMNARWHSPEGKAARDAERAAAIRRAEELGAGFDAWVGEVKAFLSRHPEPSARAHGGALLLLVRGEGMWRLEGAVAEKHAGIMPLLREFVDACRRIEAAKPTKTWTIAGKREAEKRAREEEAAKATPAQKAALERLRRQMRGVA
jgi:hypothetical protein